MFDSIGHFSFIQLVAIISGLVAGSFVQGAVGFAFALVSLPIILSAEVPLPHALMVIVLGSGVQSSLGFYYCYKYINLKEGGRQALIRMLFIPVGFLIMLKLASMDPEIMKKIVGGLVLALLMVVILSKKIKSKLRSNNVGRYLAAMSGILAGSIGIGGPPMVLWANMQPNWSQKSVRGFMYLSFLLSAPVQVGIISYKYGAGLLSSCLYIILISSPLMLLGTFFGNKFGSKISRDSARTLTYIIILIASLKMIIFG